MLLPEIIRDLRTASGEEMHELMNLLRTISDTINSAAPKGKIASKIAQLISSQINRTNAYIENVLPENCIE